MTNKNLNELDIFWWNVNNFYHYDAKKTGDRWPSSIGEYTEKCLRVDNALNAFFVNHKKPEIIALCEITAKSTEDLKQRLLSDYSYFSLDQLTEKPTLNISIFYKECPEIEIEEIQPIVVERVPKGTRPMAVLDLKKNNTRVRLIFCHWQPRSQSGDDLYKTRIAEYLTNYIYDFLNPCQDQCNDDKEIREIIILGDLNEEPFDKIPSDLLSSHRHRDRALNKAHWSDADTRKIHLYNCTWRLLGEKHASKKNSGPHAAGSFFWNSQKTWHTVDQVLVSGGLLDRDSPFIDESSTQIVNLSEFMPDSLPIKFEYTTKNGYKGLSDHLPVHTKLIY